MVEAAESRSRAPWSWALLILALATGCSSVDVRTAVTPGTDLSKHRTFGFANVARSSRVTEVNASRLTNAVTKELQARGYTPADKPDLEFEIYLETSTKTYDESKPSTEPGAMSANLQKYYGFVYDRNWSAHSTFQYTEGSLVFHAIDTRANQLVWEGVTTGVLYTNRTDEQVSARIKEAVAAAFKGFPRSRP